MIIPGGAAIALGFTILITCIHADDGRVCVRAGAATGTERSVEREIHRIKVDHKWLRVRAISPGRPTYHPATPIIIDATYIYL